MWKNDMLLLYQSDPASACMLDKPCRLQFLCHDNLTLSYNFICLVKADNKDNLYLTCGIRGSKAKSCFPFWIMLPEGKKRRWRGTREGNNEVEGQHGLDLAAVHIIGWTDTNRTLVEKGVWKFCSLRANHCRGNFLFHPFPLSSIKPPCPSPVTWDEPKDPIGVLPFPHPLLRHLKLPGCVGTLLPSGTMWNFINTMNTFCSLSFRMWWQCESFYFGSWVEDISVK